VERAFEYQRRIEGLVREQRDGALRVRLEDTADQLSEWIGNAYHLAVRLDAYRRDSLLAREREQVPQEIEALTARRKRESDAVVLQELDEVLESKSHHWETLRSLHTRMKQADLQLEQSLTALATVYSQLQLVGAQEVESGRSERLQADIREQVERLSDLLSSINEVYDHDAQTLA
jgi:seryl-tRNA synthetase